MWPRKRGTSSSANGKSEEVNFIDAESNEAHAPGSVCERCGQIITATQDARRRPDGQWVHEECPVLLQP